MTKSQYQQLVEFIAPRFDDLGSRLSRVEVSVEENRREIQAVAEGVTTVNRKLGRFKGEVEREFGVVREEMAAGLEAVRAEMASGFRGVREEMASGFAGVRDRFELQDASLRDLSARMDRWEGG